MPLYDLHVHTAGSIGENSLDEMAEFAKRLGLQGLGVVSYWGAPQEKVEKRSDIDLVSVLMIKPSNVEELNSVAERTRMKTEVLMVHGGNYDINRAACENPLVDVLCHPELGRKDSGLDHICIKAAAENNVAIEVNFREILESYKKHRVYILAGMAKNASLCSKYGTKIITTSAAVTKWGMRSSRELAAVSNLLGVELGEAIDTVSAIPEEIVKMNRDKLAGKRWEGVSVVEE